MIEVLPRVIAEAPDRPAIAGPNHPIRIATQEIATQEGAWTPERAANVAKLFDGLAPEWNSRGTADKMEPLIDALDRGGVSGKDEEKAGGNLCIEIGSGTGAGTRHLVGRFGCLIALDLSIEMLRIAPAKLAPRVLGDGSRLPIADARVDALVLVNAFLFPNEIDRVLAPQGELIWVSSLGDATPIYLSPAEVEAALPGRWSGRTSDAGWGRWTVLRRA